MDGNDLKWQKKINRYSKFKIDFSDKKQSVRFNNIGEIDFAIKSIIKYASFIRTIFLVTDNQIPKNFKYLKLLAEDNGIKLKIIDHLVIFKGYEQYLPCFNSTSIISLIHRIPNLSEYYVLFNDDTFIMRKISIEDLFINKNPVIRGRWKKFYKDQKIRLLFSKILNKYSLLKINHKNNLKFAMQTAAILAGINNRRYLRRFHNPIAMRKSTIDHFFNNNKKRLEKNIKYRFRNNRYQFITETLSNHLEIKNKTYFIKEPQLMYFRSYKNLFLTKLKLKKSILDKNILFITFQSLEMADKKSLKLIINWLKKRF